MRIVTLIALFILIVSVSGCLDQIAGLNPFASDSDSKGFVGGEKGIVASFVGNNPPSRVFQNRNFNVILQLENKGEYNVFPNDVRVFLSNGQNFGLETDAELVRYNADPLTKRLKTDEGFIPGGIEHVPFYDLAYSGPAVLTEDAPVSIALDICYPYNTTAVADICVTRDGTESSICDPIGNPISETTSGPIQVTKINQLYNGLVSSDPTAAADESLLRLKIDMKRVGTGDLYSVTTPCDDLGLDIDVVNLERITVGEHVFTGKELGTACNAGKDRKIGFDNDGKASITCDITVPGVMQDFYERFTMTVSYQHVQLLTNQISVMPVLESMTKCTSDVDCEDEEMYCEKPGFCRKKIPDGAPCGLPNNYSINDGIAEKQANKDETCQNKCLILQDPTISEAAFELYGICSPDSLDLEECEENTGCSEDLYCAKPAGAPLGEGTGFCSPKVPVNYPCQYPFGYIEHGDSRGTSCISGVCAASSGLCIL
ncbi:hypothetical protein HOF46_02125 [Candidatus Woesearchaeota archaeon]|jgi:hypothetical protein|nr:hypothetical protein [Candidatus Woesearchaeota archaeon]